MNFFCRIGPDDDDDDDDDPGGDRGDDPFLGAAAFTGPTRISKECR